MSKLIFALFALILISGALTIHQPLTRDVASTESPVSTGWGKARSDVNVRITELAKPGDGQMALVGEVRTEFDMINVEWKLPEGVTLASGAMTETLHRADGEEVYRSQIVVNVPETLAKPHLAFFAYTDRGGERIGQSRVFNLKKTAAEKAHLQKVKQLMLDRGADHNE